MGMITLQARVRLHALLLCSLLVSGTVLAATAINAVPPAPNRTTVAVEKFAPSALTLPATAPALRIALPAPSAAETGVVKERNAKSPTSGKVSAKESMTRALAIGFGRPLTPSAQPIALSALPWQALPDGSRAARIEIASPDAAALRVAMTLSETDPDLSVRFAGSAANAAVFGPFPANVIADDTARFGVYWSPTLDGDVATIELHAGPGVKLDGIKLTLPRVAHHLVTGAALKQPYPKTVADIGSSGACNIDIACVTPQTTAFANSTKAVAEILLTWSDGESILCTGTLLNDSIASNTPYLLVANHCLDSDTGPRSTHGAASARTINTYWFFDAVSCGSRTIPAYVQQTAGAALLARSEDWDWGLVRLNQTPPPGTSFSAWRAETVPAQATVSVIHHPNGDLKKWAQGVAPGYQTFNDGSSFIQARYTQGTTEIGSSGAALLTFNATGGYYEVRGGLFGGEASCSNLSGVDIYSRLDKLVPVVRQYLTPGNNPAGTVVAVEFFNRTLQHYFISTAPGEINDVDNGVHVGWERTGFRFQAYATQVPGTNPVCRFYRAPAFGDSHFYSASPAECTATAKAHPVDWIYESPSVFYIQLPDTTTGTCPAGTLPVWRFFNQLTTNHRYTTDVITRDSMRDLPSVWIPEGYGLDAVIMCTPAGG
jgi:hypothetical protein